MSSKFLLPCDDVNDLGLEKHQNAQDAVFTEFVFGGISKRHLSPRIGS